jgi:hypothetical protein
LSEQKITPPREKLANYEAFMKALQEEFGGYKAADAKRVMAYLRKDIQESRLPVLWRYILYHWQSTTQPPKISHIEEAIRQGMRNHNEGSVAKRVEFTTQQVRDLSPQEQEEARKEFNARGGLTGMWNERRKGNKPEGQKVL